MLGNQSSRGLAAGPFAIFALGFSGEFRARLDDSFVIRLLVEPVSYASTDMLLFVVKLRKYRLLLLLPEPVHGIEACISPIQVPVVNGAQ